MKGTDVRVLMTADGVGGVFGFATDLCRELAARGVEVALAVLGEPLAAHQRELVAGIRGTSLYERAGALEWMDEPWRDVDATDAWLLELAERLRPDVVHLNGYSAGALEFGAPKVVVAHSCVLGWWRAVHGEPAPDKYGEYARRVGEGLAGADVVVAPTHAMLATLRDEYGYGGGHVIPNGVDQTRFRPGPKEPYFAAAGRLWDRAKNLELVVRAAPRMPWPVRVAGAGGEVHAHTLGIEWQGNLARSDVARLFAHAPAFVHPARYEPFGLAPLEAALSGCALVLGDIPSLREVWDHAALYVSPDEPDALAEAAARLASDATLVERFAERALARARRYSASAMATRYLEVYTKLCGRRRNARSAATPSEPARGSLASPRHASTFVIEGKERSS